MVLLIIRHSRKCLLYFDSLALLNFCKGRSWHSNATPEWLDRQRKDPYCLEAKVFNYRARSAFKLIQINDKHKILKPGHICVDLGAAPGSWTQVLVENTNSDQRQSKLPIGKVIACDRDLMLPVPGATVLEQSDFNQVETREKIVELLGNSQVNVLVSDMCPNVTGHSYYDHLGILDLCYAAMKFGLDVLKPGGTFLCKMFAGTEQQRFFDDVQRFFSTVKHIKPDASRDESKEFYVLAKDKKLVTRSVK